MTKKKRLIIVVIFLTSLICVSFAVNGYSQQQPETPKKSTGEKQPAVTQSFQNRLLWQAGLEVIADLSANQLVYTGPCPTVFTFKGRIYSNRAMTVHYRFIRSDDIQTSAVAIKLDKDEKKEITYSWELGGTSGPQEFNGWIFLQVLYPTNLKSVSNIINLKAICTNREEKSAQKENSAKVLVPTGPSMLPQDQKGLPITGGPPMMPTGLEGQVPGNFPMPQPGQTGQGPGGMPMFQPGQKGPVPSGPPMPPGNGKGLVPRNLPMPQPDIETPPGVKK